MHMRKQYLTSVSIIALIMVSLNYILNDVVLVFFAFQQNKATNPFILDSILETAPYMAVMFAFSLIAYLVMYLCFRSIFGPTQEERARALEEAERIVKEDALVSPEKAVEIALRVAKQSEAAEKAKQEQRMPLTDAEVESILSDEDADHVDEGEDCTPNNEDSQEALPDEHVTKGPVPEENGTDVNVDGTAADKQIEEQAPAMAEENKQEKQNPVAFPAPVVKTENVEKPVERPVVEKKDLSAWTEEEVKHLRILQKALDRGCVPVACYSIGEFEQGKVSLFKNEAGSWRIAKPTDSDARMARGYRDLVSASKKFVELLSMVREV